MCFRASGQSLSACPPHAVSPAPSCLTPAAVPHRGWAWLEPLPQTHPRDAPPWLPQPLPHPRQPAPGSAHLRGQWGAGVARPPTGAQETQRELANLTFAGTPLSLSVRGSLRCTSWLQGLPEVLARPQAAPQVGGASFQLLAPPSAPPVRASEPWAGARPWKAASDLPSISSRPHRKAGDSPTTWTRP